MKIHLFTIVASVILLGCNHSRDNSSGQLNQEIDPVHKSLLDRDAPSCYLFATDRDTVFLQLDPPDNGKVTGELNYLFYERDSNVGRIEGEIYGDTLLANYTFMSEGMISVREVAFLVGENQVMEGYGDVQEKGGRMVFLHTDSLDFSNGLVMPQVPCDSLK